MKMNNIKGEGRQFQRPVYKIIGATSDGGALFTPEQDSEEPTYILENSYLNITNEVHLKDLATFINNKAAIENEFYSLPREKYHKSNVARKEENKGSKHRYSFCEVYDYNRVVLKAMFSNENINDYIAASHIDSFSIPRRFISTQAPLPQTFNDFWKMVYDYNCTQIVSLNELIENNFVMGHKYWPESSAEIFGSLCVTKDEIKEGNDFDVNKYKIKGYKGELEVEHYFFKRWPDLGVPSETKPFFNLIESLRESPKHQNINPVIVHCSAGCGRSGTFILFYNMIEMGEKLGKVDVHKYYLKLRTERAFAIVQQEQYFFVYKCLVDYFME